MIFALLLALTAPPPTAATVREVPASYPTIQSAIDAAASHDTVLVAPGTYVESLTVDRKDVALIGRDGFATTIVRAPDPTRVLAVGPGTTKATVITGLSLLRGRSRFGGSAIVNGSACRFLGCRFARSICRGDTAAGGGLYAAMYAQVDLEDCVFDSCAVLEGDVAWGGAIAVGIGATVNALRTRFHDNLVAGAFPGIGSGGAIALQPYGAFNATECSFTSHRSPGPTVIGNGTLRLVRCRFDDNSVTSAPIVTWLGFCDIAECLFTNNHSPRGVLDVYASGTIVRNTFAANSYPVLQASAVVSAGGGALVTRNIIAGSRGFGLIGLGGGFARCNDLWNNELGAVSGNWADASGNFAVAPMFCDSIGGDFHLEGASPCATGPCDIVGAFDAGCATLAPVFFQAARCGGAVCVRWRVPQGTYLDVWLERASASNGPWRQIDVIPTVEDSTMVGTDRSVAWTARYGYRLVAATTQGRVVLAQAWIDPAQALPFGVGPNPSTGAASVQFTLPMLGMVDLGVFDLAGRRVDTILHGWEPAGPHEIAWDSAALPPGIYKVRIRHPSGEDSRTLVRIR